MHRKNQRPQGILTFSKTLGLIFLLLAVPVAELRALEIVSPPQYTEVHPGETVVVVVRPSAGENISGILCGNYGDEVVSPPYACKFTIGPNQLGDIVLSILAGKPASEGPFASADDAVSSVADLHLKSTLPSTLTIQSLRAKYTREKITLYLDQDKATGNYLPDIGRLRVYAMYSDGVERPAFSASAGTIYSSSNEKILTINADGIMTALTPGKVQITVRSGDKKIVLDATVLPK